MPEVDVLLLDARFSDEPLKFYEIRATEEDGAFKISTQVEMNRPFYTAFEARNVGTKVSKLLTLKKSDDNRKWILSRGNRTGYSLRAGVETSFLTFQESLEAARRQSDPE